MIQKLRALVRLRDSGGTKITSSRQYKNYVTMIEKVRDCDTSTTCTGNTKAMNDYDIKILGDDTKNTCPGNTITT